MGAGSKIEWTDATWNPVMGCTPVSEGCKNCYARSMMTRFAGQKGWPETASTVTLFPERLTQPLRWKKPRRIFVNSMSDLFHEDVPFGYIDAVFDVMAVAKQHTFQLLTKREDRMARYFRELGERSMPYFAPGIERKLALSNVWVGVTCENQKQFNARYPYLAEIDAAVRYVSLEPLLGPIDMGGATPDWVICGGESGPGARSVKAEWVRSLRDQCIESQVPFFFKQWGAWFPRSQWESDPDLHLPDNEDCQPSNICHIFEGGGVAHRIGKNRAGRLLDGHEWNEHPG